VLLMISSEHNVRRLQAHAGVKPPDTSLYQRNNRGPIAAPAKVHSTTVPPYQTKTNGNELSVQYYVPVECSFRFGELHAKGLRRSDAYPQLFALRAESMDHGRRRVRYGNG